MNKKLYRSKNDLKNYIKSKSFGINHIRNSDVVELYFTTSHNPKLAKFAVGTKVIECIFKI